MGQNHPEPAGELREFDRFEVPTVSARIDRDAKSRRRRIEDLSKGGVFLYASKPQAVGTPLTVKLSWPCRDEEHTVNDIPGKDRLGS